MSIAMLRKLDARTSVFAALYAIVLVALATASIARAEEDAFYAGLKSYRSGQYQDAIRHFSLAIESGNFKPLELGNIHYYRGDAYAQLKQHDAAIKDLRRAIELSPRLTPAYLVLGESLYETERRPLAAREAFIAALRLLPDHWRAHRGLGRIELSEGRWEAALPHFEKTLAQTVDANTWVWRGNAYRELNRLDDAIASYRIGLLLAPWWDKGKDVLKSMKAD